MDRLEKFRNTIKKVLKEYSNIAYSYGDIKSQIIFDNNSDHYLLIIYGMEGIKRVHGCILHLAIVKDKIWIHRDETEDGIVTDLLKDGISKDEIVLGFYPTDMRRYSEFAFE